MVPKSITNQQIDEQTIFLGSSVPLFMVYNTFNYGMHTIAIIDWEFSLYTWVLVFR